MFELLKRKYADKNVTEIAKEAIELGYNSKMWTTKTHKATELRNIIAIRLAKENELSMDHDFDEIIKLTNEVMSSAAEAN